MGSGVSKRRVAYVEQQLKERVDGLVESAAESTARWAREDTEVLRQEAAAVLLEQLCRVRFALRECAHVRAARAYHAAQSIQARVRSWSARCSFCVVLSAAVTIQKAVRVGCGGYPDTTRRKTFFSVQQGAEKRAVSRWQWWYTSSNLPKRLGGGSAPARAGALRTSETPEANSGRGQKGIFFDLQSHAKTILRVRALTAGALHVRNHSQYLPTIRVCAPVPCCWSVSPPVCTRLPPTSGSSAVWARALARRPPCQSGRRGEAERSNRTRAPTSCSAGTMCTSIVLC